MKRVATFSTSHTDIWIDNKIEVLLFADVHRHTENDYRTGTITLHIRSSGQVFLLKKLLHICCDHFVGFINDTQKREHALLVTPRATKGDHQWKRAV